MEWLTNLHRCCDCPDLTPSNEMAVERQIIITKDLRALFYEVLQDIVSPGEGNDRALAGVPYNFLSISVAFIKTQLKDVEIRPGHSVSLEAI